MAELDLLLTLKYVNLINLNINDRILLVQYLDILDSAKQYWKFYPHGIYSSKITIVNTIPVVS